MKRTGGEAHAVNSHYCDIRRLGWCASVGVGKPYAKVIDNDGFESH